MKKRSVGIVSLCCMFISYYAVRYLLFDWHGMKSFPFYLLVAGIIVIAVSGIIIGSKLTSIFTTAGYIVGFFIGYIFQADSFDPGGGRLNNMWVIWTVSFVAAIIAGIFIDIFCKIRQKRHTAQ